MRQLVSLVFERALAEDGGSRETTSEIPTDGSPITSDDDKVPSSPTKSLEPFAQDAFMLFQVYIINYSKLLSRVTLLHFIGFASTGEWGSAVMVSRHDRNDKDFWNRTARERA